MPDPTGMSMKKALVVAPIVALVQMSGLAMVIAIAPVVALPAQPVSLLMLLSHFMAMKPCPTLDGALAAMALPDLAIPLPMSLDLSDLVPLTQSHPAALATKNLLPLLLNM
jgi:hypothetical protein